MKFLRGKKKIVAVSSGRLAFSLTESILTPFQIARLATAPAGKVFLRCSDLTKPPGYPDPPIFLVSVGRNGEQVRCLFVGIFDNCGSVLDLGVQIAQIVLQHSASFGLRVCSESDSPALACSGIRWTLAMQKKFSVSLVGRPAVYRLGTA